LGAFAIAPRRWLRREWRWAWPLRSSCASVYMALWQHGGLHRRQAARQAASARREVTVAPMLLARRPAFRRRWAAHPRWSAAWRIDAMADHGELLMPLAVLLGWACCGCAAMSHWRLRRALAYAGRTLAGAAVDLRAAATAAAILDRVAASAGAVSRLWPRWAAVGVLRPCRASRDGS